MRKEERALRKLAREFGLSLSLGGSHFQFRNTHGALVAVTSATSSDHRAMRNLRSQITRHPATKEKNS